MQQLHVGRGTSRGALTVFPVWGEYARPRGYSLDGSALISEQEQGAVVSSLTVTNRGTRPLLMLEGQLVEGGLQNRVLERSVLVPAQGAMDLDVFCVEAGRWVGGRDHERNDRRASLRVRSARTVTDDQQGEVWRRVAEYQTRFGANDTDSLVEHDDRAGADVDGLVQDFRTLPGQVGVVVGISGQPVMAEIFDSPSTLLRQFRSLVRAAGLDALGQDETPTPSRRARRFVERASRVQRQAVAPAGVGTSLVGSDEYATVRALAWRRRDVHLVAINPRHPLNLVSAH